MNELSPATTVHYEGETAPRNALVATALTALHPALGYLYVGKARASMLTALFFVAYLATFLISWALLQYFPLLPMSVLLGGWVLLTLMCLVGVLREVRHQPEDYLLRGFNHAVVYALVYVMLGLVPIYATYYLSTQVLWGMVKVNDNSMYPSVVPGDTLLIDRMAYSAQSPQRGQKVVVRAGDTDLPGGASVILSRVVAVGGDKVQVSAGGVLVNDAPLERFYYGEDGQLPEGALAGEPAPFLGRAYIEDNHGARYVVAGELSPAAEANAEVIVVAEGEVLLMSDHRSAVQERPFMAAATHRILGRPRYILYSESIPEQGDAAQPRWSRVGLRVD